MERLISGDLCDKEKTKQKHGHKESIHCVVKRGRTECSGYDERKVYGSTYAACYVVRMSEQECEKIADASKKFHSSGIL